MTPACQTGKHQQFSDAIISYPDNIVYDPRKKSAIFRSQLEDPVVCELIESQELFNFLYSRFQSWKLQREIPDGLVISPRKAFFNLISSIRIKDSPSAAKEIRRPRDRPKNQYKTRLAITNYNTNPLP